MTLYFCKLHSSNTTKQEEFATLQNYNGVSPLFSNVLELSGVGISRGSSGSFVSHGKGPVKLKMSCIVGAGFLFHEFLLS